MLFPLRQLPRILGVLGLVLATTVPAWALITGGTGNTPVPDPGWPAGALTIFNTTSRVAFWEGPPFGGGQSHAECRGDAAAFQIVLDQFAKLPIDRRELTIEEGVGRSFWLNPNRDPAKKEAAEIDWIFMVWQPASLKQLQGFPPDLRDAGLLNSPLAALKVYVGGRIDWKAIEVPEGVTVIDNRPTARGYTKDDGTVIEGTLKQIDGGQPLAGRVQLVRLDAPPNTEVPPIEVVVGADGKWKFTKVPTGPLQVQAHAEGYVSRKIGFVTGDEQPRWYEYHGALAVTAMVTGKVVDAAGNPLAGVNIQCYDLVAGDDRRYDTPNATKVQTDAEGRFRFENLPKGRTTLQPTKPGYVRPGLGQPIDLPQENVVLTMQPAAALTVTVDFSKRKRPEQYLVEIEPEGGSKVGSWGGSAQVDADGVVKFTQIPPGKYVVSGKPNPTREGEQTAPVLLTLPAGKTTEHTIVPK